MCSLRAASALLLHTNLLLALYGGAGLAMAARLKWDPTIYIPLREIAPREYHVAAATLTAASVAFVVLGHLAVLAISFVNNNTRRLLLLLYVLGMSSLLVMEVALVSWLAYQVVQFLHSEQAQELAEALEVRDHLRPLLHYLGKWHPLPPKLRALIDEAEADLPRNGYVAMAASMLLVILQVAGIVLAVCAIRKRSRIQLSGTPHTNGISGNHAAMPLVTLMESARDEEAKPFKTAYKNGRLMIA